MKRIQAIFFALACGAIMVGCNKGATDTTATTTPTPAPAATTAGTDTTTTTTKTDTSTTTAAADSSTSATSGDLAGTWDVVSSTNPATGTAEFTPDGNVIATMEMKQGAGTINAKMEGTYKMDGSKMTTHFTKTSATGSDDATKKLATQLEKSPPPADSTDTITWVSKDEFTTTSDKKGPDGKDNVTTFKRKAAG